jgi:uncharacterized membrane protein
MQRLREFSISAATVGLCMLLGAAVYESRVMAPNYALGLATLEHARGFLVASTPAAFFRIFAPVVQLLLFLSVVLAWRAAPTRVRWLLLVSLCAAIATDVVTYTFHYPRNEILFVAPIDRPEAELLRIAQEWAWGNYVRIGLLCVAVAAAFVALRTDGGR